MAESTNPRIMYVCEDCAEHASESCGHYDRTEVRLSPSGRWLCEYCFDEEPYDTNDVNTPTWGDLPIAPLMAAVADDDSAEAA